MIVFLSDNGVEGRNVALAIPMIGDWPRRCCDNSLENVGTADSYTWLGAGWGRVGSGPYRRFKSSTADGGIRVPAILRWSGAARGAVSHELVTVRDLVPTFLDLAGIRHPGTEYRGRPVHSPSGASLLPYLRGEADHVHAAEAAFGWELSGRRALRHGDWKILQDRDPYGVDDWTLHNLAADPGETVDLRHDEPERFSVMLGLWEDYRRASNVIGSE